jgi:hypothetical protein
LLEKKKKSKRETGELGDIYTEALRDLGSRHRWRISIPSRYKFGNPSGPSHGLGIIAKAVPEPLLGSNP